MWRLFIQKHHAGELIDLDTGAMFKEKPGFKLSMKFLLNREFFRHFGHFTDKDFRLYVEHLLNMTPGRIAIFPKVSVSSTIHLYASHHTGHDWVERRKRKRIVVEELVSIKSNLAHLLLPSGSISNKNWKKWKVDNRVSSGTYNFLLYLPGKDYFSKRLTNEGKKKRAKDFVEKFPDVVKLYTNFLRFKSELKPEEGQIRFRAQNSVSLSLRTNWDYDATRALAFSLMDVRNCPGGQERDNDGDQSHFFANFDKLKGELHDPAFQEPIVWLWVFATHAGAKQGGDYASQKMDDYDVVPSMYVASKNERLNDGKVRGKTTLVYLLFLLKRGNDRASSLKQNVREIFSVPDGLQYYDENRWYNEIKYRVYATELRMEFYIELLQRFSTAGEGVLGIHAGSKFMLAAKMLNVVYYGLVDYDLRNDHQEIKSKNRKRMDMNDFLYVQCPYLPASSSSRQSSFVVPRPIPRVAWDPRPSPPLHLDSPIASETQERIVEQDVSELEGSIYQYGSQLHAAGLVGDDDHHFSSGALQDSDATLSDPDGQGNERLEVEGVAEVLQPPLPPMHIILSSSSEGAVVGKGDGEGEVSTPQEEMSPATANLRANVRGEGAGSSMDAAHFQSHEFITPKEEQDFWIQKNRRRKEKAEEQEAARIFRLEMEEMKKQLAMMKAALQLTSEAPILPPPTTCYTTTHALQAVSPHMAVVPLPTTVSMAPPVTTVGPHVLPMAEIVYESEMDAMSNPLHLRSNHTLHAPVHGIFTNSDSLGFGSPLEVDAQATLGQPKLMNVHPPDPVPAGCGTKGGPEVDIVDYEPHNDDLIDPVLQERADDAYDIEVHLQIDPQSNTKAGSADKD